MFLLKQSRTIEIQKLAKWRLSLLAQSAKNHHPQNGFRSDAYECTLSEKNMCLTEAYHYKHSKMTIFDYALTQERIGTFLVARNLTSLFSVAIGEAMGTKVCNC